MSPASLASAFQLWIIGTIRLVLACPPGASMTGWPDGFAGFRGGGHPLLDQHHLDSPQQPAWPLPAPERLSHRAGLSAGAVDRHMPTRTNMSTRIVSMFWLCVGHNERRCSYNRGNLLTNRERGGTLSLFCRTKVDRKPGPRIVWPPPADNGRTGAWQTCLR